MQRQNSDKNKFVNIDNAGLLNINPRIIQCHELTASNTGMRTKFVALLRELLLRSDFNKAINKHIKEYLSQIYNNLNKICKYDEFVAEYKKAYLCINSIEYAYSDKFTLYDIFEYMEIVTGLCPDGTIKNKTSDTSMEPDEGYNKSYTVFPAKSISPRQPEKKSEVKNDALANASNDTKPKVASSSYKNQFDEFREQHRQSQLKSEEKELAEAISLSLKQTESKAPVNIAEEENHLDSTAFLAKTMPNSLLAGLAIQMLSRSKITTMLAYRGTRNSIKTIIVLDDFIQLLDTLKHIKHIANEPSKGIIPLESSLNNINGIIEHCDLIIKEQQKKFNFSSLKADFQTVLCEARDILFPFVLNGILSDSLTNEFSLTSFFINRDFNAIFIFLIKAGEQSNAKSNNTTLQKLLILGKVYGLFDSKEDLLSFMIETFITDPKVKNNQYIAQSIKFITEVATRLRSKEEVFINIYKELERYVLAGMRSSNLTEEEILFQKIVKFFNDSALKNFYAAMPVKQPDYQDDENSDEENTDINDKIDKTTTKPSSSYGSNEISYNSDEEDWGNNDEWNEDHTYGHWIKDEAETDQPKSEQTNSSLRKLK